MLGVGECCFGVMYCEWYGVCDFVVLSVVEVCADFGGVNVFHVCLNFLRRYMMRCCFKNDGTLNILSFSVVGRKWPYFTWVCRKTAPQPLVCCTTML